MAESEFHPRQFDPTSYGSWQPDNLDNPRWEQRDSTSVVERPAEVLERVGPLGHEFVRYLPKESPLLEQVNRDALAFLNNSREVSSLIVPEPTVEQLELPWTHEGERILGLAQGLHKIAGALERLLDETYGTIDVYSYRVQADAMRGIVAEFAQLVTPAVAHIEQAQCHNCLVSITEIIRSQQIFNQLIGRVGSDELLQRLEDCLSEIGDDEEDDADPELYAGEANPKPTSGELNTPTKWLPEGESESVNPSFTDLDPNDADPA